VRVKAAEHCLADGGYPQPELAPDTGKRIGIVGAGPSSLTAAYYLRTYGHQVEVFESQEEAGGMLRYGIPAYRMPPDLLDQEIEQIRVLGVSIHTGTEIGSLETFKKDYDAGVSGPNGPSSSRSTASIGTSCSEASNSSAPSAAAKRSGSGRGSWSSAAATSRSMSP
jgi:phytoene dehydrogenase-like protein